MSLVVQVFDRTAKNAPLRGLPQATSYAGGL